MVGPYIKFISNSSLMTIFIRAFCRAIFLIILDILINIIFLLKPISSHFFFYLISLNLYFPIDQESLKQLDYENISEIFLVEYDNGQISVITY